MLTRKGYISPISPSSTRRAIKTSRVISCLLIVLGAYCYCSVSEKLSQLSTELFFQYGYRKWVNLHSAREVKKVGPELGPGAPGGYPPGVISLRCRSFVSENISHADPQIEPIFSLPPLHRNSSKICSFPHCLEIQHAALGSNTRLWWT